MALLARESGRGKDNYGRIFQVIERPYLELPGVDKAQRVEIPHRFRAVFANPTGESFIIGPSWGF
jgi:hypothetical protein